MTRIRPGGDSLHTTLGLRNRVQVAIHAHESRLVQPAP
jgi:hypothetical protein